MCVVRLLVKILAGVGLLHNFEFGLANILKGRGSEKQQHDESPNLHSSYHTFYVLIMVVSNSLRNTLIWCIFQHIPGGVCPQTPHTHRQLHATHAASIPCTMPLPPSPIMGSAPGFNQSDYFGCRQVESEMTVRTYFCHCKLTVQQPL